MDIYFEKAPKNFIRANLVRAQRASISFELDIRPEEEVRLRDKADLIYSVKQDLRDKLSKELILHGLVDSDGTVSLTSDRLLAIFDLEE